MPGGGEIEVSPGAWKFTRSDRGSRSTRDTREGKGGRGWKGRDGSPALSRGAELIREGWKRDFPNARQPAEPNVIMRGEDFIMERGTP